MTTEAEDTTPADEQLHASMTWSRLGLVGPGMVVIVLALITSFSVPQLADYRPWKPDEPVPFWNLIGRPFEAEELEAAEERHEQVEDFAREALAEADPVPVKRPDKPVVEVEEGDKLPAYVAQPGDDKPVQRELELFEGDELDVFFEQLARSDSSIEGAVTRVVHWGDSVIGLDGIPGAIRARMQARFGDSGHGFHLMAPPNTSYRHGQVKFDHNEQWELCFIIQNCKKDGRYGMGGATFWSYGGAESKFRMHPERSAGTVSSFEVSYLAHPKGGKLWLRVDKEEPVVISTRAEVEEERWHKIEFDEPGDHTLRVRANAGGQSRVYGVAMERDVPGVVWDSAALVGAFTKRMLNYNEQHLREQLDHRGTSLAVLMFGGNDMIREHLPAEMITDEYRQVIAKIKAAKPDIACLVMSPLDHGIRKGARIVSKEIVPIMVEAQRAAAEAEGCAFFDTYSAMGGEGSAGRWYRQEPRLMGGDLGHATMKGHVVIGEMLFRALLHAYIDYRKTKG